MDKSKKLKRYQRKDYTQRVQFPVEIIGRDGLVRRYSFEASVRLYQRRIASAPLRYHDPDVAGAEAGHCRSRIAQLRQSYCEHYGWPGVQEDKSVGEFAGEVVAFLRRFLGEGEVEIKLASLGSDQAGYIWFVEQPELSRSYLLYLYPFESNGPCVEREAFFQLLRYVQGAKGDQVEHLTAFHHTADCGLVLTASGKQSNADLGFAEFFFTEHVVEGPHTPPEEARDAFQRGLRALSVGDANGSLVHFEHAIAENPYRHRAHACVVAVTDYLERPRETAIATRAALHYFSENGDLQFMQAVAFYKMGDLDAAEQALEAHLAKHPEGERPRALQVRIALAKNQFQRARHLTAQSPENANESLADLMRTAAIGQILRWRPRFAGGALVLAMFSLGTVLVAPLPSALFAGFGLSFAGLAMGVLPRKLSLHLAESQRFLGLGLPENLLIEGAVER
jgi:tetratricopeptide (TPR) repeat protein